MYEQWVAMEQFYYNDMWVAIIIAVIAGVLLVSTISHFNTKIGKIMISLSTLVILASGYWAYSNYQIHSDLIDKLQFTNPLTRSYTLNAFSDPLPYSISEEQFYRVGYLPQSFENLELYNANTHLDEIEYMGRYNTYYYFKINDRIYYTSIKNVEFTTDNKTYREGVQYTLIDERMADLGFTEESRIFYLKYLVPQSLEDLELSQEDAKDAIYQGSEDIVANWIMP
ncbi:hypothetical protein [Fundicoccus culcitae]|uniref:DUF4811 domain-containing protein n=1 Tax=Fundicoccus culcitae TaxID=2969821 RepID=A0ABY5P851_9LACT|nr:hypothetical protein [Fundicoccus culcitae]UUX34623.1 hypothetical protein NRE15_02940 [Fundicoccus culcitae]